MEFKTRIYKGREGYEAHTDVAVDDGRTAKISTSKRYNGKVETYVSVGISGSDNGFTTFTHAMYSDYSKCFAADKIRCTEKSVAIQHAFVLNKWDTIQADISRFYNKEPALCA